MRLATRVQRLARGSGCPMCGTDRARFVINTASAKRGWEATTAEYERCLACGRRVLSWFTIAVDHVEVASKVGD